MRKAQDERRNSLDRPIGERPVTFADALDRLGNPAAVSLAQIIGVAPGRFKDADGVERVERGSFLE